MFKTQRQKARKLRLTFREPVTVDLLTRACAATGIKLEAFLKDPESCLDDLLLSYEQAREFMSIVLVRPPKLGSRPLEEALAVGYYVLTDFFLHTYLKHSSAQLLVTILKAESSPTQGLALPT